jgi:transmembrane sensor
MDNSFEKLLERYKTGTLTEDEGALFLNMLKTDENEQRLAQAIDWDWQRELKDVTDKEMLGLIYQQILMARETPVVKLPFYKRRWVAVAASVILILTVGTLAILSNKKNGTDKSALARHEQVNDVGPGQYKARLTLADGSTIILDSAAAGELTRQGGTVVINKDGQLVYSYRPGNKAGETLYNTLSTARGETYATVLGDGSKVWLNAASSIRFPVSFSGNERRVTITGEAYFEVAHDAAKPFHVTVNGMDVQVLGTHFNINSYADEGVIKTTLLEGSIKVAVAGNRLMVKPGQQAQVQNNNIRLVSNADTDAVMAWKNGFFAFEGTDIKKLMTELSRWYDIEVIYRGMPDATFTGKIDRSLTLSQLLQGLADAKVNYKIEGKKLIILP